MFNTTWLANDPSRFSYKLHGEGYALDTFSSNEPVVNEKEMSFILPFADGRRRDGVGDLLEIGGIDCSRHLKNPLCLLDHGKSVFLPIGSAEDPKTKRYTVNLDPIGKSASAEIFVYQGKGTLPKNSRVSEYDHALFCHQIFDLWAKKYLRAGSIGYQVVRAIPLNPDPEKGLPQGQHLLKTLLLEVSVVVLPANQDTTIKSLDAAREILCLPNVCGKPLSPYLAKSLESFVVSKSLSVRKWVKSYFADCPRDEKGHCKAKGSPDEYKEGDDDARPAPPKKGKGREAHRRPGKDDSVRKTYYVISTNDGWKVSKKVKKGMKFWGPFRDRGIAESKAARLNGLPRRRGQLGKDEKSLPDQKTKSLNYNRRLKANKNAPKPPEKKRSIIDGAMKDKPSDNKSSKKKPSKGKSVINSTYTRRIAKKNSEQPSSEPSYHRRLTGK